MSERVANRARAVGPKMFTLLLALLSAAASARGEDSIRYVEPDAETGSSKAVVVGPAPLAHTTQLFPLDAQGKLVGKGRPAEQAARVLDNIALALKEAKSGPERIVKLNVYAARLDVLGEVRKALAERFRGGAKPAVSFVVGALPQPDALVAMDAVAVASPDPGGAVKLLRSDALAKAAAGSHVAILPAGPRVYVAGQAEKGASLADATRRTLASLRATLNHLGLDDSRVVQLKAFVTPMTGADAVRKEMAAFFGERPVPPVVLVEWESSLPIEIELIAAGKGEPGEKAEAVEYLTPPGMKASPVFSRVARVNHGTTIYTAGLYGTKSGSGEEQIEEIFAELRRLMKATGSDFRHLAKATYYVSDDEASRKLNELRPKYYDPRRPPAASKAMVPGVGMGGKSITLDMIAVPVPGQERPPGPGQGAAPQPADELLRKARSVLAQIEGEIAVPGLKEPVEVLRDRWGV
ncbi:MAG TPA: RidA family protein, partial [Gemmataceae bacterium]